MVQNLRAPHNSSAGPNDFPLTDKLDVQLYNDSIPIGEVFHLASFATGYVGFVSAVPFNRVAFTTVMAPLPYIDGYPVPDPYQQVYDNVRFAATPLSAYSLYVADLGTSVIYGYTVTGAQSPVVTDLDGPTALAFDTSGNLYEGDAGTGIIYKAAAGGGQTVFASGFGQILGLAFDASGNLFTSSVDANKVGSIIKITAAGVQSTFASGLTRVRGLAFDGSGNLYEAELDTGSVSKYTPAGVKSTFASGFNNPTGIAFDASGNLFVCSQGVGVFKVTPAGVVSTFTTNVTDPRYLAFDAATGNLFVTDVGDASGTPGQGNVYQFASDGTRTTFASNLAFPSGIAVAPSTTVAAPVITSAGSASAQVSAPFAYQIAATNAPTTFTASGLPAGLSANTSTGLLSGTPTASGVFTVALSATNSGGTGTATLSLTVTSAPVLAPSVTSARSATAHQSQPFSYQIAASNSPTSFAATGLPAGLSVNAVGSISGTPNQAGSFSITLSATNGGGTGTAVLTLTVVQALPVASLMATTPTVIVGSGDIGEFTLSLSEVQSSDVQVNLLIKGTGINGTDYVLLKTTKKINAGKTSKPIKVIPQGDLDGATKKTVVLELAPGDGYTIGTAGKVKVKITSGQ